jgi:hypothetical protein
MSTTAEKLTYLNTTKTLIKDNLNLGGANISNEPFRVYSSKLIDIYKDFLAHGTDTLWNNWNKVNGTGESLTLNNTIKAKMKIDLKGNTSQEATPTPDNPQDIHVVSGDNTIDICGKNLFDGQLELGSFDGNGAKSYSQINYRNVNMIPVEPSTTYTFSINGTSQKYCLYYYNSSKTFLEMNLSLTTGTFTTPANTKYINFRSFQADFTDDYANLKVQLEKGNQATTFEAYKGTSYPISLGEYELCKIGDYQDSIVKDNDKWYLNKQIGKVVLDGSENWQLHSSSSGNNYRYWLSSTSFTSIFTNIINKPENLLSNLILCDRFIQYLFSNTAYGRFGINTATLISSWILFNLDNSEITDITKFRTWLSTHNTTVYYVLATPTTTEITDSTLISQLEAIKLSYNGQTNITQANDDKPFILDVTALGELEI